MENSNKRIGKPEIRVLREYLSGVPLPKLVRKYEIWAERQPYQALTVDYKRGKIDGDIDEDFAKSNSNLQQNLAGNLRTNLASNQRPDLAGNL